MSSYQIPNNQNYKRPYIDTAIRNMGYDIQAPFIEIADLVLITRSGFYGTNEYALSINNSLYQPNLFHFDEYGHLLPISGGN